MIFHGLKSSEWILESIWLTVQALNSIARQRRMSTFSLSHLTFMVVIREFRFDCASGIGLILLAMVNGKCQMRNGK